MRPGKSPPIYVEIDLAASMEEVWQHTQDPVRHEQWDLRFTNIEYLPRASAAEPQRFRYVTRIGFGLEIEGTGESVAERQTAANRTSVLRFGSEDAKSLIRTGGGFWRYREEPGRVRFSTRYDYETRFGLAGRLVDRVLFRPLLGWATAWSFDCLRLWLERSITPSLSVAKGVVQIVSRGCLSLIWLWLGLVPKLLYPEGGELALVVEAGLAPGAEGAFLALVGAGEITLGLALAFAWRWRFLFPLNLALAVALSLAGLVIDPGFLTTPMSPPPLLVAIAGLSFLGTWSARDLPSARRCLRREPGGSP